MLREDLVRAIGVLAQARCNEVSLEDKTITGLWHLCHKCLNLRAVIFLCDINLPLHTWCLQ